MTFAYFLNLAANGLIEGLIIALAALAITLLFGIAKFANASTGDVMTVGAYAALIGQRLVGGASVGALLTMSLAAALSSAVVALLCYLLVFRRLAGRNSVTALVASIGVSFVLRCLVMLAMGNDQQVFKLPIMRSIPVGPIRVAPMDLYVGAASLTILAVVFVILHLTPIGRKMRAVADNPALARASGINAGRVMLVLWLMFGVVSGLAGLLLGVKTVVTPEMGWDVVLPAFAATILGSIGNPVGAVLGGILMGIAQEVSTPFVGFTYKIGVGFLVMTLVLLVRPQGLFSSDRSIR